MIPARTLAVALLFAALSACADSASDSRSTASPPLAEGRSGVEASLEITLAETEAVEQPGIHNLFRLSESIISGGEPHGEEALKLLADMGVKTILSVDGKVPDAETAGRFGMRYVHVPIQYSGIPAAERLEIAKAFRELPGPFYVHCFHGKHRGPAAAAWGRVVLDGASREQALAEMRQWCGTSKKYGGLFDTIAHAAAPTDEETGSLEWDFPSAHRFEGFRQSMVGIARSFDHLKALEKRGFAADPEHPDVDATNEAGKLADLFGASRGLDDVAERPEDFRTWLAESEVAARGILTGLEANDVEKAKASFAVVMERCDSCHGDYRND